MAAGTQTPQLKSITLAGDTPPPLDAWLNGVAPRVNLQSEITWSGFNDGYVDGGAGDSANPYLLLWWDLEPLARHCADCPPYAAGSPYDPPWFRGAGGSGNQLNATPGDGHTECGAACKCSLRYGGADENALVGGQDPRGAVWDSPNAPPAPPNPDGTPGKWPSIATVDDLTELSTAQQEALQAGLDAYRTAADRWEAIRGNLPNLPTMFAASDASNWPTWEALSPAQQLALRAVFEAMAAYDVVAGSPSLEDITAAAGQDQAEIAAMQAKVEGMASHLDDFVDELNQATDQDWQELFGKGPWKRFLWQLQQDFEAVLDWFYNRTPPRLSEPASASVRLFNPYHYPAGGPQGGEFAPKGGGEAGGEASAGSSARGGSGGAPANRGGRPRSTTPEKVPGSREKQRAYSARAAARKRQEQAAQRTPEERAWHESRAQRATMTDAERLAAAHAVTAEAERLRLAQMSHADIEALRTAHAAIRERMTTVRTAYRTLATRMSARHTPAEHADWERQMETLRVEYEHHQAWLKAHPLPESEVLNEPPLDDVVLTERDTTGPGTPVLDSAPARLYTIQQSPHDDQPQEAAVDAVSEIEMAGSATDGE